MDGETAVPATKRSKVSLNLPSELVLEIMTWLPVKSLMRLSCVCKAWRDTISHDAAFHRAHLRVQTPRLLISTSTEEDEMDNVTTIGLYVSEESATLADTMDLPLEDETYYFSHCNGLLLMPTKTVVRVVNPATRRVLPLPWSLNGVGLAQTEDFIYSMFHQVFGIGYDPRNDTYKVARFFFGPEEPVPTGGYHHSFGMEVFTIGVDEHWRETVVRPPYPVDITGTSAFASGSLFWTIDHTKLVGEESPSGFLRFRLEDESFSVTLPPPCCQGLVYEMAYLGELHGELGVAHPGPNCESIEIWTCNDVDTNPPLWTPRYIFSNYCPQPPENLEIAMYDICKHMFILQVLKDIVGLDRLIHHDHDSVMPYIPSLVPI